MKKLQRIKYWVNATKRQNLRRNGVQRKNSKRRGKTIVNTRNIRIGSLNCRWLTKEKLEVWAEENSLDQLYIHMLLLQETKEDPHQKPIKEWVQELLPNWSWISKPRTKKSGGIGILVRKMWLDNMKQIEINGGSNNVTWVKISDTKFRDLIIGNAYMPDSSKSIDLVEREFDRLTSSIQEIKNRFPDADILLGGDLNGRVGNNPEKHKGRIGTNEAKQNKNGSQLAQFLESTDFYALNGRNRQPLDELYTWRNSRGNRSVIDYFTTQGRNLKKFKMIVHKKDWDSDHS